MWQTKPERGQKEETKQSRWGFRGMTVRTWLELLIVPVALVVISFLFTSQQDQRQQQIENQRARAERNLAEQRAQDEALQAYLDHISGLLLEKDLRASAEDSEARTLARSRTLTVLERLDPSRKAAVASFLVEADLVQQVHGENPVIALGGADLSGAELFGADLSGADLNTADLKGATLGNAKGVTNQELEQKAKSLEGATMPNGQKYEDWLKSKDRE